MALGRVHGTVLQVVPPPPPVALRTPLRLSNRAQAARWARWILASPSGYVRREGTWCCGGSEGYCNVLRGHGGEWQVLRETNFAALLPFEKAKPQRFADFLDGAMGFS